ncbi:MAG: hypothetical protein JNK07_01280 [Alphaproteobacteria bacterium]|nr:hypothetical protein [Alphaproteobacteria bacterium]
MPLFHVRLELARSKEHPNGSARHGYEFVAPLDATGHLSSEEWKKTKAKCTVRRFTAGADDEHGRLIDVGRGWHFDYDAADTDDDEPLYKLDRHQIKQGEYLSITEHDGVMRTFKVVRVEAI